MVARGSLSRNGFLTNSNSPRYGGYALKGLRENLRFYDDRRRLDRRALRHGTGRPPRRVTHLSVKLPVGLGHLSARLVDVRRADASSR